jgi:hypothetical protein
MPDEEARALDLDSAGVYEISVEAFEARSPPRRRLHSPERAREDVRTQQEVRPMRTLLAALAATVAMYLFGVLYWGAASFPYSPWLETQDDAAAQAALREHFPESGVYYVPGTGNEPERRDQLFGTGPVGFVYVDVDGRPAFDPGIMVRGFLLNGVIAALLLWLFRLARVEPRHGARIGLAALVGLVFVVVVHLGDVVWWVLPVGWELSRAFYNFTAFVLAAAVLSAVLGIARPE